MRVAVDETLALGLAPLEALRRDLEDRPLFVWSEPMGPRMAASPAILDDAETDVLARLAAALPTLVEGVLETLRRRPVIRRRLRHGIRGLLRLGRTEGARMAQFGATWPLALFAFLRESPRPRIPGHRIDGFFLDGTYRIMEIATGPTAWSFLDEVGERFLRVPPLARLVDGLAGARVVPALAAALVERSRLLAGDPDPRAAILHLGGPPDADSVAMQSALREADVPADLVHPRDLAFDGRALSAGGRRVTMLLDETRLVDRLPLRARWRLRAISWRAHRAGAVVLHQLPYYGALGKGVLALLSDGTLDAHVDRAAGDLFRAHLPWTRLTEPGRAAWIDGTRVDLEAACVDGREHLVCKPLLSHSGAGIVFGEETPPAEWRRILRGAFAARDRIVQERLRPPRRRIVGLDPPGRVSSVIADTDAMVVDGRLVGVLQRYSTTPLTNYTADGADARTDPPGFLPTWFARGRRL